MRIDTDDERTETGLIPVHALIPSVPACQQLHLMCELVLTQDSPESDYPPEDNKEESPERSRRYDVKVAICWLIMDLRLVW